jgi:hypothetical protein
MQPSTHRKYDVEAINIVVPNCTLDINSETQNPDHHNVFTFTLSLSEGRTGEAWEPSKNYFPLQSNMFVTFLTTFHFRLLFFLTSYMSLFLFSVIQNAERSSVARSDVRDVPGLESRFQAG